MKKFLTGAAIFMTGAMAALLVAAAWFIYALISSGSFTVIK